MDTVLAAMGRDLQEANSEGPAPLPIELKKLSQRHKNAAALLAQGVDRQCIAAAVEYTPEYITWLQRQPLFITYVKEMSVAAGTRLEAMFSQSVEVIAKGMQYGTTEEQLRAAKLQMEATGRIGRYQVPTKGDEAGDRLEHLADRLVDLLHRKRTKTYEVTDAEIVRS